MDLDLAPDDELIARAAAGDGDAFAAFYRRHLSSIVGLLLRSTGDRELTADLTAEVFAAALLACPRYRPGEAPALSWLCGIASNKLAESWRQRRVEAGARRRLQVEPQVLVDEDLDRVDELASSEAGREKLHQALALLPEDERDALVARIVEERGYPEIAAEMQCSEMVVRKRVSRGLGKLRNLVKEAP